MKKRFVAMLTAVLACSLCACGSNEATTESTDSTSEASQVVEDASTQDTTDAQVADTDEEVMSYEEYMAADLDSKVVVETYVQDKQSWWEDKATVYTQDEDGAYFIYNMECSSEDYDKLEKGTKIKVTGYKSEWSGEVEIVDATFEIEDGNYIAEAIDVTDKLASEDLIDYQNMYVSFTGLTVEAADDNGAAFLYNYDGSGTNGDDLYFNVSYEGVTYTFTVESYLTDADSDVYKAVEALEVGDVVDMEGYLYWYEGVNPHITSLSVVTE